jgi:hypothetical protein
MTTLKTTLIGPRILFLIKLCLEILGNLKKLLKKILKRKIWENFNHTLEYYFEAKNLTNTNLIRTNTKHLSIKGLVSTCKTLNLQHVINQNLELCLNRISAKSESSL